MSGIKISACGSCGFKWPTGQHGEHSCSSYLKTENVSLQTRITELELLIKEADDYLNTNKLTTICNGSILHAAFKEAIKDEKGS